MLRFMREPPKEEFGMTFFDIDQGFNGAGIEEVRIEVGPSGSVNKTTLEKPKSLSKVLSPKKQALNNQVRKSHQFERSGVWGCGFFTNSRRKRCLQQCLV